MGDAQRRLRAAQQCSMAIGGLLLNISFLSAALVTASLLHAPHLPPRPEHPTLLYLAGTVLPAGSPLLGHPSHEDNLMWGRFLFLRMAPG